MILLNKIFNSRSALPGGAVALYTNRLIQNLAAALIGLFLPIFLFQHYQSLRSVLFFYLAIYSIYLFLAAPGAMVSSKINFKNALIISVFGGTTYYLCFYFFDFNLILFSILATLALVWDLTFYWVPYETNFAKFTDKKSRGWTLGSIRSLTSLIGVLSPVLAGFIITNYDFEVLFLLMIVIYFSSIIPLFFIPLVSEQFTFGYLQTWKILFHPRDRKILFTYMADGAESIIGAVIWPIFIWQILAGDYQAVGLVSSFVTLVTVLLQLLAGKFSDKFSKKQLIRFGSIFYSLGWLAKIFVQTGFQIFIVSTYHNFAAIAMRTPFETLTYEKAADSGHYIDEYSVLREMSLCLGRILMILVLLILLNFVNLNNIFILAAIVVLFVNLI